MRIISGKYRGKKLFSPKVESIRPTSDRAKEGLFNILNFKIDNDWASFDILDVFSGSGALGLEAISRGANSSCLIDIDVNLINKNVGLFPLEKEKITIQRVDMLKVSFSNKKYNLVFLDAPYEKNMSDKTLLRLSNNQWIADNALCIVELERQEEFIEPENFTKIDERIYGFTKFIFLKYQNS